MPNTGSGTYQSDDFLFGFIYRLENEQVRLADLEAGRALLVIDFATGKVTGEMREIQVLDATSSQFQPWNDVKFEGGVASGTNRISGAASVTSNPARPFSLAGDAVGTFDGKL
jgi:hypothetical protein